MKFRQKRKIRLRSLIAAVMIAGSILCAGTPALAAEQTAFSDVRPDQSYYEDLCWAVERGIVTGSNGKFRPEAPVTVEQFFTLLSRSIPEREEEKDKTYFSLKDSMRYHLRRSIQNGWADVLGATVEYRKDSQLSAGYAWYIALSAYGTQVYSSALYGEPASRKTDGMNAAKLLELAAEDADAAKIITRAEAVQIIRAAAGNMKTLPKPEIIAEMQGTITGLEQGTVNQVYEDLLLVPAQIREAFCKDGWKISFDADKIAKYSEQNRKWGIRGMTSYREKTIYLASADALLHEMGHYYQEKLRSSGMDANVYAVFDQIHRDERWSGSMLADSSNKDGAEFFADAFAYLLQTGKVRSDPSGEDAKTGLESQRYFEGLAKRGWIE